MNVKHSSANDAWMTPRPIMDRVYDVLEKIDLDPASSEAANARVQAKRFICKEENGLTSPWLSVSGTVFLNPPGGRLGRESFPCLFWQRLMIERNSVGSMVMDAIFLGFSIEMLQTSQNLETASLLDFPFCIPSKRIAFDPPEGPKKHSPTHANVIVYVPGLVNRTHTFAEVFKQVGKVHV